MRLYETTQDNLTLKTNELDKLFSFITFFDKAIYKILEFYPLFSIFVLTKEEICSIIPM